MALVLIIDDEDAVRFTLRKFIEAEGHVVVEAVNGDDGLKQFETNDVDLVITDIIMPDKEGIETIVEIKRDHPDVKIIAISGGGRMGSTDFLEVAKKLGADEILPKPFTRSDVLEKLTRYLASPRSNAKQ